MDIQLLSSSSSPTLNVLAQTANLDKFLYNLSPSTPNVSRQKVEVKAGSTFNFGKTNDFNLNRYGILVGAVLKLKIKNYDSSGSADYGANFGHMAVSRAVLSSHSREICQTHDVANLCDVLEMPLGVKENLRDIAKDDDGSTLANGASDTVYVPLTFPFLKNGLGACLDLSFVEQITCSVSLANLADLFEDATTPDVRVEASDTSLICYFLNLQESDLRKLEDTQYSLEKPLSMMSSSIYKEAPVSKTFTANGSGVYAQEEVTINFNVPNCATKTMIYVDRRSVGSTADNGAVGTFYDVAEVAFTMSGREVWKSTGTECNKLENSLFYGGSYSVGIDATNESIFVHRWGISCESNMYSGAVSGKNVSDFSCNIKFKPADGANDEVSSYRFQVQHEYINVVSISGSSGKVAVALSL